MNVEYFVVFDVEGFGRVPDVGADNVVDAVPFTEDGVEFLSDLPERSYN